MKYRYSILGGADGITKSKKRFFLGAIASLALAVGMTAPALAATGGYCVNSSNGCSAAIAAGAQCGSGAGSGAFGAFGQQGDVMHDFGHVYPGDSNGKPGANGQQTGINNSSLCGSRSSI